MKATLIALFVTSSLFGQAVSSSTEGPVYNHDGQKIAYRYADDTRESYAYNSAGSLAFFVDRAGHVTQYAPAAATEKSVTADSATTSTGGNPDSTLFTTYGGLGTGKTAVTWFVCGSTQQTEGCYGAGNLGPFGKIGALLEGPAAVNTTTNTVTRQIYILDIASGGKGTGVTLYVYKKIDMVSDSFDTVDVSLLKTLSLPLKGGATGVHASMAGNPNFIYVGTNQSPAAVKIQKSNFAISQISLFSPSMNVAAITSDPYGYVTITFGGFDTFNNAFVVFDPNGFGFEDGGGADFMLNAKDAVLSNTLQ
jgi:hypothetical protein